MKRRLFCICASVCMAFSGVCLTGTSVSADADYDSAAKNALAYAERASGHFYYDWLAEFDKAAAYKRYYTYLDGFCKRVISYSGDFNHDEYCIVLNADSPVSWAPDLTGLNDTDQLNTLRMFMVDHPYYAFIFSSFTIDDTMKIPLAFHFDTAAGRKAIFAKINKYIDSYSGAAAISNTYERAQFIHDALCVNNTYTYDSSAHPTEGGWPNNIYGPIYYRTSVCEGYAVTFNLLARYYGLESACVFGSSHGEAHMWNILKMDDGLNYYVDVTWDDCLDPQDSWSENYNRNYFVKGSDLFDRDHERDTHANYPQQPLSDPIESRVIPALAKNDYGQNQSTVTQSSESAAVSTETQTAAAVSTEAENGASVQTSSDSTAESNTASIAPETTALQNASDTTVNSAEADGYTQTTEFVTDTNTVIPAESGRTGSNLWIVVLSVIGASVLIGAVTVLLRKRKQ